MTHTTDSERKLALQQTIVPLTKLEKVARLIRFSSAYAGGLGSLLAKAADSSLWYIGKSDIEGNGVFANKDFSVGDVIGVAMTDAGDGADGSEQWSLTTLGQYCNHQKSQNADVVKTEGRFDLVAVKDIPQDTEIVSNYYQVTNAMGPFSTMLLHGKPVAAADMKDYKEGGPDE